MKIVFPSKVDVTIPILFGVTTIPAIVVAIQEKNWTIIAFMTLVFGFIMYLLYDTNYTITPNNLKVHSGFMVNKNIAIASITSIAKTDSLLNAPASSLSDRIEIFYGSSKSVIISPNDRQGFIAELLRQNPVIVLKF